MGFPSRDGGERGYSLSRAAVNREGEVSSPASQVLITTEDAQPLDGLLRVGGLVPVHRPLIRTIPLDTPPPCERPGVVILSSARAAALAPALDQWAAGATLACVGAGTAEAARRRGLRPEIVGEAGAAELIAGLAGLPRPWVFVGARSPAPAMGRAIAVGEVLAWPVYDQQEQLLSDLPEVALVLLASPSAARAWARSGGTAVPVVVIGETTASAARACGLRILGKAERPGWAELAQAAAEALQEKENGPASGDTSP